MEKPEAEQIGQLDTSHKILIVSRNLDSLRVARTYLATEGFSVMTTSTIEEAMQLCEKTQPNLFILDSDFSPNQYENVLKALKALLLKIEAA